MTNIINVLKDWIGIIRCIFWTNVGNGVAEFFCIGETSQILVSSNAVHGWESRMELGNSCVYN